MDFLSYLKTVPLPPHIDEQMQQFYHSYKAAALENGCELSVIDSLTKQFLDYVIDCVKHPFTFDAYHQRITSPIDFYHFGLDFIRPLVVLDQSKVLHTDNLNKMDASIAQGHNVILFANHQTELDPQAISLLLEKTYPKLAEEMIFIAGHRVVSDFMAIPFSKGRNLLCIYSKKYIEDDSEHKEDRRQHNQRTMMRMSQLLSEGGKCIYVAPSGGRDRPRRDGYVEVAHFDPQSIEMFWLMSQRAERPTHFYSLALSTYDLLPPPDSIKKKLGEPRHMRATPIHLAFGKEIEMAQFENSDKKLKRKQRAEYIWKQVCQDYQLIAPHKN